MKPAPAIVIGLLVLPNLAIGTEQTLSPAYSGGETTVFNASHKAFSLPARNLSLVRQDDFFIGQAFFRQPWVIAPSSTKARDGLGPLFSANSCSNCHVKNGRGVPPSDLSQSFVSSLVRLSQPATDSQADLEALLKIGVVPETNYGDQLQHRSMPKVPEEATPRLSYTSIKGEYHDGTPYTLVKPILQLDNPRYGKLHPKLETSIRVAPPMTGMGLIESLTDEAILANADPDDKNKDGISGRANYVWDVQQEKTVLGRFGLKANQPNLLQQNAAAFSNDISITSPLFPKEHCTPAQTLCHQAPHGGKPEISAEILQKVTFYTATLGVPARRGGDDPVALKGEQLFKRLGCNQCHIETFKTAKDAKLAELANQTIHPYSDFLLHDMGEGLADNRPDFKASGTEWRTAPLWGVGLTKVINKQARFLHDGRARTLAEAILWHGGEAEPMKQAFVSLDKSDRDALIRFLNSL